VIGAPDRIRVVTCLVSLDVGGAERLSIDLARGLDPARFDVRFACMRRWGPMLPEVESMGIPLREYHVRGLYRPHAVRQQLRFARDLRREGVHVVHAHNFYGNMFAIPAARLAGVPAVVASVHDLGIYHTRARQLAHMWTLRLADRIFVVADAIRTWLVARGVDAARITVLRNGIDLARFRPGGDGDAIRGELALPPHVPVVAMISRLVPLKGIEDYLVAAARVVRTIPDVRFLVVGSGHVSRNGGPFLEDVEYRRQLEGIVARLGLGDRIVFTGFRQDVPRLLQTVAVSVLPSFSEGLSNVVLESMAAGVPVVTTRVGGTPEAVEDGVNGLLVSPGDPIALAEAMSRVLTDPSLASRLAENARRHIAAHFSLDRMIHDVGTWYRDLTSHPSSRFAMSQARRSGVAPS
jgi:glycosyltransferase involved in cell wall biosynthesis